MTWQIWLDDPTGYQRHLVDTTGNFELAKALNYPGGFTMQLPKSFDEKLIQVDGIVEFWRSPVPGINKLFDAYFIRKISYAQTDAGDVIYISGPSLMDILRRRIVAYAAGTAQASQTDQADDLMKSIVKDNLGSDATAARQITGLTIASDQALGPSLNRSFAWRNLLELFQEIVDGSQQAGTYVYFDVVPVTALTGITFKFITWINQKMDRTASGDAQYFGPDYGNMVNCLLDYDYTEEVNYVYAGGQGEGSDRTIVEVTDTARAALSPYNRCEMFVDARNETSSAAITDKADAEVKNGKPRIKFTGTLLDTNQSRFGIDWDFGDKITCSYRGLTIDGYVKAMTISVDGNGAEYIDAQVEAEQ